MRPLKIAFLSRWYWEENRRAGGAHASGPVQQLAEAVAELGHEVVVLSQSPEVGGLERSKVGALETWLSPREQRRSGFVSWRDKLAKQVYRHRKVHSDALDLRAFLERRGPFDVLWANCEEPDGLVAAIASERATTFPPTLVQIYALRYRFRGQVPMFNEHAALRQAFRVADRIIANSDLVADRLDHYSGAQLSPAHLREKVRVVPHNLLNEFVHAALMPGAAHPAEPGRVLFLGALNEKKGALVFLEAIQQTQAIQKGAVFAMTGKFTEKNPRFVRAWEAAEAEADVRLAPAHVEMLGKISPAETIAQIRRASVVVMPSLFDEWGRVVVEALALERPVITTEEVGSAVLVREHGCGLVAPPHDAAALAEAIDEVLRPGAPYADNAKHIANRMLHDYSAGSIARQMAHHLAEIVPA